ncbi:DNA helicase-2 / ATP-dependent DNA helicase PcrA [Bifidobacterium bohemicum]|uniref:DNA 3'-5' helicase n=1 Tax=Bifidobacterium bohemicum DSM 22767 TaxID=1437606 RepID=A0A086ZGJ9_9BIFI|nr:ATP-dependent helicase [Bifidobacterium bohemicum]KFI45649.1 DNA helicaseII-like protein [Bifidobacterium bohemicum DSM 22767]SCB99589.1 DNA helicase-2 / ATP-dependent DNA helicase PcrA [Bifidobacterium bohemicum]
MIADARTLLEGLDEAQLEAATTLEGPVRIIAGAGAGKTRTVTRRIAYACASRQWRPSEVLAVTFSVKAANEMKNRLGALGVEGVKAATFHSAALHQLCSVWPQVSDAPLPHVCDDPQMLAAQALKRSVGADGIGFDTFAVRDVLAEVSWAKVGLIAPDDYARVCSALHHQPPAGLDPEDFAAFYLAYEEEKSGRGQMDFNDILLLTCHVLEHFDEQAAAIRRSVGHLTVDEYQDVSPLQHRLMTLWLNDSREVCVVGDPAQTIYSFAGASSYSLLGFDREFGPLSADVDLNIDYRSTPQVVSYANRVLSAAPDRENYLRLQSPRAKGMRVMRNVYDDDAQEAIGVAQRIAKFIDQGSKPQDCAVLTRLNAQQQVIARELKRMGLRSRVRRDAGWSSSVLEPEDEGLRDALEAVAIRGAEQGEVTISTIHASKGLEFKHVFIVGCSEGLLPYGSPSPSEALEEERRLFYVGVTRAEDTLHLSYAKTKDGVSSFTRAPSRFLYR